MKKYKEILKYVTFILIFGLLAGCDKNITDFGFDASISGNVFDDDGNLVSGDVNSNVFVVNILGESETVSKQIKVDAKGFYKNTKLFPQPSKVWLEGAVASTVDTLYIDFSTDKIQNIDFTVTPNLTLETPVLEDVTSKSITVSYNMIENGGNTFKKGYVIFSTVPYPTKAIGSGPSYSSANWRVYSTSGTLTLDELESGVTYYIRSMAYTNGANAYNFSHQLIVTTP